jgi:hypothetical protein
MSAVVTKVTDFLRIADRRYWKKSKDGKRKLARAVAAQLKLAARRPEYFGSDSASLARYIMLWEART